MHQHGRIGDFLVLAFQGRQPVAASSLLKLGHGKAFDEQSQETDVQKCKKLVWEIDKKLQEDVARPIIFHSRRGTCWQPYVKGITIMVNSSYNGYRYEDVWLNK